MLMLRPMRLDDWGVGIVAVDRLPPPPQPRLRAFIWCKRDGSDAALLNGSGPARPVPAWLMVGSVRLTPTWMRPEARKVKGAAKQPTST